MTKTTWPARLTPFTGGAALALLILALVMQPAHAMSPACTACQAYWNANATKPGQPCAGMTGMAAGYCTTSLVYAKCVAPLQAPAVSPCGGSSGPAVYADCASEACSVSYQCAFMTTTACTGNCNGCDANGSVCNLLMITPIDRREILSPCKVYCGCGSTP